MTVTGWVFFALVGLTIACAGLYIFFECDSDVGKAVTLIIVLILIIGLFCGMKWYFNSTASGQRAMVDQQSDFKNGMERTITIYTANGEVIAQYTGRIDIEGNDGGYVLFDFEGKRYTYYNCFVESVADIGS